MNTIKRTLEDKRIIGILLAVIIGAVFVTISLVVNPAFLRGTPWFILSSILRIIFGIAIIMLVKKTYGKSPKELLAFNNARLAILSGAGFLLFFVYYLVDYAAGFGGVEGLSAGLVISRLFLMQLTTGFYEELNYRVLILEGYRHGKQTVGRKIVYALISFVIFGLLHVVTGWNTYTFLQTGAIGFAFAVIYLNSGNVILPMILHFVYDIFANLAGYVKWNDSEVFASVNSVFEVALVIMFVVSFAMLFVKDEAKVHPN